jgi:hypothetical protein
VCGGANSDTSFKHAKDKRVVTQRQDKKKDKRVTKKRQESGELWKTKSYG